MKQKLPELYVPALRFRFLTPFYDAVVGATTREAAFKKALIDQAEIEPEQNVLDLADGTGTLAVWNKQNEPQAIVTGVDGDSTMVSLASRKALRFGVMAQFDHALSYDLAYPTAHFDCVASSLFFHHLSWDKSWIPQRRRFEF